MEPVTLLMGALAAGASAALKDTAGQAVKDAYAGLKALIMRRLEKAPTAKTVIEEHAKQPEVWEKPMQDLLIQADAGKDAELLAAAQRLMALLQPSEASKSKFDVSIGEGAQGVVVGDHARVDMSFGDQPGQVTPRKKPRKKA